MIVLESKFIEIGLVPQLKIFLNQSASAEMTERMWDKRHRFVEQGIRLYRLPTNTACYVDPDWYNIQVTLMIGGLWVVAILSYNDD